MRTLRRFVALATLLALPACSLFTETPGASGSCRRHEDCFRAQGEGCDLEARVCCDGCLPDASPIDAEPVDVARLPFPDASLDDAGAADATP